MMTMLSTTLTPTRMQGETREQQQQQRMEVPQAQREPIMFPMLHGYFNNHNKAQTTATQQTAAPSVNQLPQQPHQGSGGAATSSGMFPVVSSYLQQRLQQDENTELGEREKRGLLHKLMGLKISSSNTKHKANIEVMEDLIAEQNEAMTFEEKERAAFDVHGLSAMNTSYLRSNDLGGDMANDDGPSLVEQSKLLELDLELPKLRVDMNNPLVKSEDFRLMFLRCDDLNVKVAAQRIKKHLDFKGELFGHATLHRHIEYSDLGPEDIRVLESGILRISPHRDSAGRTVLLHCPNLHPEGPSIQSRQRAGFYTWMQLMRNTHIQKHGIVMVLMTTSTGFAFSSKESGLAKIQLYMSGARPIKACLPRKIAAVHHCIDTSNSGGGFFSDAYIRRMFAAFAQLMARDDVAKRMRTHSGLRKTIEFQLTAYGIRLKPEDWPTHKNLVPQASDDMSLWPSQPIPLGTRNHQSNYVNTNATNFMGGQQEQISLSETSMDSSETSTGQSSTEGMDSDHSVSTAAQAIATASMSAMGGPASPTSVAVMVTAPTNISPPDCDDNEIVPVDSDVLFGRGKSTRNHPGNMLAMKLVHQYRDEYEKAKKFEKTAIAERIVHIIAESAGGDVGGRFLKFDNSTQSWMQVDSQTARNKISHLYRNTRNRGSGLLNK